MGAAWDRASAGYLAGYGFDDAVVNYGPWAPDEATLNLLGDVRGLAALDAGCGGGHNSVALARAGAGVTGLDGSGAQLHAARGRADAAGVTIRFVQGGIEEQTHAFVGTFDLILCNFVLHYVDEIAAALDNCSHWLRPGGRFVAAMDHPIRACFQDEVDDGLSIFPVRNYFDRAPVPLQLAGLTDPLPTRHRTVGEWTAQVVRSGLMLERLVEPQPPRAVLDEFWPEDGALSPLRMLPQVLIVMAGKPA